MKIVEKIRKIISRKPMVITEQQNTDTNLEQVWVVQWLSITKSFSYYSDFEQMYTFRSEEDARMFAKRLEDAQKILKNRNDIKIRVYKQDIITYQ